VSEVVARRPPRRLSWLAYWDPRTDSERMCTWSGETRQIVVTGLGDLGNVSMNLELPPHAQVHEVPREHGLPTSDADPGRRMAVQLGGVLFTVFVGVGIDVAKG
jgi:hypothetical protein